jgi:hypothetical protein
LDVFALQLVEEEMEQTQTVRALKTDQTQFFLVSLLQEEVEEPLLTKEHLGGLEEELHTIDQHHLKD